MWTGSGPTQWKNVANSDLKSRAKSNAGTVIFCSLYWSFRRSKKGPRFFSPSFLKSHDSDESETTQKRTRWKRQRSKISMGYSSFGRYLHRNSTQNTKSDFRQTRGNRSTILRRPIIHGFNPHCTKAWVHRMSGRYPPTSLGQSCFLYIFNRPALRVAMSVLYWSDQTESIHETSPLRHKWGWSSLC